jgi:hypothetical protein
MLNKITRIFYLTFGTLWGLNALYVFLFAPSFCPQRLFGFWETNKWIAGIVYLFFSFVFLSSEITKFRKKDKSTP